MRRSTKETLKKRIPVSLLRAYHQGHDSMILARRLWFHLTHPGGRCLCNCCGRSHSHFMPDGKKFPVHVEYDVIGAGYRDNSRCPSCFSKDRERLLLEYLRLKTNLFGQSSNLLHVAPERNLRKVLRSSPHLTCVCGDLDGRWADVRMDVTHLPFPDGRFDVILCNHVLEHVSDDRRAMVELFRVLKPGGWGIFLVPIGRKLETTMEDPEDSDPGERERRFGQIDHVRIYGLDYMERLEQAGFVVDIYHAEDFLTQDLIQKLALNPRESIFHVSKD